MKVIAWKREEGQDAEIYNLDTIEQLWTLVEERTDPVQHNAVHEISSGTELDEKTKFLVLAWVEVED